MCTAKLYWRKAAFIKEEKQLHIHLSRPDITEVERQEVSEVLHSQTLSMGPKTKAFEELVAERVGTKFAVAVNSGTSGLHLLLRSLGVKKGDEIITTPFSFIASSNCILFQNATPVFADIDPLTLNIDPAKIEAKITPRTKGILPVHVFGHPANMEEINRIALKYNLFVIEDACEAIGAKYRGQNAGTLGDGAVFAFYPNKQITTGEGGIIVTNNEETAWLCRSMRNQGRGEGTAWLGHERLGFNYRMDEISAALGLVQIKRLNEILAKRNKVAEIYKKKLSRVPEITPPFVAPDVNISWFVFVIRLPIKINRDNVMKYLLNQGIECRPYFTPIHLQPFYQEMFGFQPGDFPITEEVSNTTLALPFYNNLTEKEIDYVLNHLEKAVSHQ